MPIEYQSITVYKETDRIVVENNSNTFKFFGATMEEAAQFLKILLAEQ